jgi:hypothetical protein
MKKKTTYLFVLFLIAFIILALRPIDTSKENSVVVIGTVTKVYEGGVKDLVFKLKDNKTSYYINRGLENGFTLQQAKKDFTGKKIVLNYAKCWTPLAPLGTSCKHITYLTIDGNVVYSEWK